MVDVGGKERTARVAVATATVRLSARALSLLKLGKVEKGDVPSAARLAGIMAAKRTPDLIPLCHPIALTKVEVDVRVREEDVQVRAEVATVDRTGVEMEALTAASAAALTIYDMLKAVDRGIVIEQVSLERKSGGRTGDWRRAAAAPATRLTPRRGASRGRAPR